MCSIGWHTPFMGFPFGILFMLLLVGVAVYGIRYLKTAGGCRSDGASADKSSSMHILENRLASGDIDVEEFEKLKRVLQG